MPDHGPDFPTGFEMTRCWRNRTSNGGTFQGRCDKSVDPQDELGLCPLHIEELRETNEESHTIHTKELDIEVVLC